ncbi:MAG TPA: permease prefix domain 1-containing protein [Jiangellaceae bacterium]|nr:permease prefix domain 1-containing protein [Jiangellaceae bacterium]
MASHRLIDNTGTDADAQLDAYLADLARRLCGPRRHRAAILAEIRDGLHHASEDHIAAGLAPTQAGAAAIRQFGDPQAVADAFAGELATGYARRTVAWYIATGPLVGVWWLLLLQPHPWNNGLVALLAAIPVLPVVALVIATAAGTFATTGRLMRWLPEASPHRALAATAAISTLCVISDATMITIFAVSAVPVRPLAVLAIAGSITRIACSLIVIRTAAQMWRRCQGS